MQMKVVIYANESCYLRKRKLLIEKINNSKTTQNSHFLKRFFAENKIKTRLKQVYLLHLLSFFLFASFSFFDDDEAENK